MNRGNEKLALWRIALCIVVLMLIGGCAGGSRGTGSVGSRTYEGMLVDNSGAPLAGVTVTLQPDGAAVAGSSAGSSSTHASARAATENSDVTDESGNYSIELPGRDSNVTFTFSGPQIQASFVIEGISEDVIAITVDFKASEDGTSVEPTKIDVSSDDEAPASDTPTPQPTPDGGDPAATPTPDDSSDDGGKDKFVTICHQPRGEGGKPKTLTVSQSALDSHLAHGDTIGPCPKEGKEKPASPAHGR